jgi:hypothetical protein
MANAIKFSNGMVYDANPSGNARFMFDPSPGSEADPRCIGLDDLLAKVPKSVDGVYAVNRTRGCFDLSTRGKELILTDDITVMKVSGGSVEARVVSATSVEWPRYEGLSPYHGLYYIIVDFNDSVSGTIYVLNDHDSSWPAMANPVIIGSFFSDANEEERGVIQGLCINNDDVTVDGEYIYNKDIVPDRQVVLAGSEKNALKLNTSDYTFSVDAEMYLTLWQPSPFWYKTYTIPVSSGDWDKGNRLDYDGRYYIIAEIFDASLNIAPIIHVRTGYGTFSPGGTTYLIGGFNYDSVNGITGITYPGDLMVDGVAIWGGGGVATDVYAETKKILKAQSPLVIVADDIQKKITIFSPGESRDVEDTNIMSGTYSIISAGSNGRTYFGSDNGIKVLDDATGQIMNTNVTSGTYYAIGTASNGRTYFADNAGVKVLNDATGNIDNTNIAAGIYRAIVVGSDGKTYFGESYGIRVLNNATGNVDNTNITTGTYRAIGIGSDGKTYFGGNAGIKVLNDATGNIDNTNITSGDYRVIAIGSDGKTYFGSTAGVKVLNDATGQIMNTNVTSGTYYAIGTASNGRTYFCGTAGIKVLNDSTGNIDNTNITSGIYYTIGIGSDGLTYFGSDNGIKVLDNSTGLIGDTNITSGSYHAIGTGSDGHTYFGSAQNGIKVLKIKDYITEDAPRDGRIYARSDGAWVEIGL